MGSDNLFHKRKNRGSYRRKGPKREVKKRVLIVCEGGKTEKVYFEKIKNEMRLTTTVIEICGDECGSAPISVVDYAIRRFRESKRTDPFDSVYCVFDKDSHPSFQDAKKKLTEIREKNKFKAIISVPCFEVWLLLHYQYSTAPFAESGKRSICSNVIRKLEKEIPDYEKGMKKIPWDELKEKREIAIKNAIKLKKHCKYSDTDNPSTNVDELIEAIMKLN